MSIIKKWQNLSASNRFLFAYPFWFLLLFGLFYWGRYWSLSPLGHFLDTFQRNIIMAVLDSVLNNKIVNYDIVINSRYHVVITPECNGFVPYFIFLAAVLAYPKSLKCKILWAVAGYFIFSIVNLIRLYLVTITVNNYGTDAFFLAHDIGGNLLLIIIGGIMFIGYLDKCYYRTNK